MRLRNWLAHLIVVLSLLVSSWGFAAPMSGQQARAHAMSYLKARGVESAKQVSVKRLGLTRSGKSTRVQLTLGAQKLTVAINHKTGRVQPRRVGELFTALLASFQPAKLAKRLKGSGYAASVESYQPGAGAGLNANQVNVVLGKPQGYGTARSSLHALPLGAQGSLVVKLGRSFEMAPGLKLKAFENYIGGPKTLAMVSVSADGQTWYRVGESGHNPTHANAKNGINPETAAAGGDLFHLSNAADKIPAGTKLRFVKFTDLSSSAPAGSQVAGYDVLGVKVFK